MMRQWIQSRRSGSVAPNSSELGALERAYRELAFQKRALDEHAIVAITDRQGTITYVNDRFCQISGYTPDELIGQNHRLVNSGHHDQAFFREMYATITRGQVWRKEICNRAKDGRLYWVDTTIVPDRDESGRVTRYIAVRSEITARVEAQQSLEHLVQEVSASRDEYERVNEELVWRTDELAKAQAMAESANHARGQFLAHMSHEMRTPLTAIIGFAELLPESLGDLAQDPELSQGIETITRNAKHLLGLINDVLDYSKIEAGAMTVEPVPMSLHALLQDVHTMLMGRAGDKNITLNVTLDDTLPMVIESDPTRLKQVFINIVGNAIKFTQDGGVAVHAKANVQDGMANITVAIKDTGIGMTEPQVRELFRPFTQADRSTSRKFGGTGLGLAISRELTEKLGGQILVESQPGQGSVFSVQLKGVPVLAELPKTSLSTPTSTPSQPRSKRQTLNHQPRVLVVDDSPDNRRLLKVLLTKAGAQVTLADNGREAVDLAWSAWHASPAEQFELVLMDVQMPELDGHSATRELRQRGYTSPIVALTAHAMEADRLAALEAGCDGFATKPVQRDVLIDLLHEYTLAGGGDELSENIEDAQAA